MRMQQQGATLLELVIVLIVVAALSVGAYLRWPGNVLNLNGQAWQLTQDLSYAQSLAMTAGQRYRVVRLSSNTYQIQDASGIATASVSGATTVTLNGGITFGTLTNLPNNLINFGGQGIPYVDTASPGTALTATAVWTLTAGSETAVVSVTQGTGRVTVP